MIRDRILQTAARGLTPILIAFGVYLTLRGHNAPGGGFAGGLVAGGGLGLHALAFEARASRQLLGVQPLSLVGWGLSTTLAAGLGPVLFGHAPLTGLWTQVALPWVGGIALGTPIVFDAGVFVTVLGMTATVVFTLEER